MPTSNTMVMNDGVGRRDMSGEVHASRVKSTHGPAYDHMAIFVVVIRAAPVREKNHCPQHHWHAHHYTGDP
jgi:hypothetical protein